jgi:hypothetical protein
MREELREEMVYFLNDVFKMFDKTPPGTDRDEKLHNLMRKYHLTRRRRKKEE